FIFIFLQIIIVNAEIDRSEYFIIVEENGNAVIGANYYGVGEITIPLQEDYERFTIQGGFYINEDDFVRIAIGNTQKAVFAYSTGMITEKQEGEWIMEIELETITEKDITVMLPGNAIVKNSIPDALIEDGEITKVRFSGTDNIRVEYEFPKDDYSIFLFNNEGDGGNNYGFLGGIVIFVVLLGTFVFLYISKNSKDKKRKTKHEELLQTLSENEGNVVRLLIEMKKPMKRNHIKKKLDLAKSSLAAVLNNLEKKKIVAIDKTYTTHIIKLNDWVNKK
ncbi:hypothetical protein HN865_02265, partial [Candidatus Woesearchaeota archaeon]|nr:hypothetical protein [Candidatus Woesearchaeota archaeon]